MSSKDLMKGALVGAIAASVVMISASAMAGTGIGGVFNLGKTNKVNAQSTLTGKASGKNLQLTNTGSGSGLGISVGAGKHPIVVNAAAGKATNLNADKLDGHDSTYYATKGYSAKFNTEVVLEAVGTGHTLMSMTVPKGHYIVIARLHGETGSDNPGGNNYRYDCALAGTDALIDAPTYRVGEAHFMESYMTYEGAYSGRGPITLTCSSGNSHTVMAETGSMVAIKVGA